MSSEPYDTAPAGVQSVVRSLALLNAVAVGGETGLSELAATTSLSPSTAHRLLATLAACGYVTQDADDHRYRLGVQVFALASASERDLEALRQAAAAPLTALRDRYDETANLVVLDRRWIVYIDQVPSLRPVRMFSRIGNRVPAHASGAGKALLAHAAAGDLAALAASEPFEALTPKTITTAAELERQLARIRRLGYALDQAEYDEDVTCVAAPVMHPNGRAIAALSVSGPQTRMRRLDLAAVGGHVADAARAAASNLSGARG